VSPGIKVFLKLLRGSLAALNPSTLRTKKDLRQWSVLSVLNRRELKPGV
jgi:hypothetical protein